MLNLLSQIIIPLFSGLSIFLISNESRRLRKWGYIVGIMGEPAWLYTTIQNEQWGILILSLWYTFNFIKGLVIIKK